MIKIINIIIYLCLFFNMSILEAQTVSDCDLVQGNKYGAKEGDNFVELHFGDVSLKDDGYLYFSIYLKKLGDWYEGTTIPSGMGAAKKYTNSFNVLQLMFNYTESVFTEAPEVVRLGGCPTLPEYDWGAVYKYLPTMEDVRGYTLNPKDFWMELIILSQSADNEEYYPIPTDNYLFFAEYRWKVNSNVGGATSTGIKCRTQVAGEDYYIEGQNSKGTNLGFCITGAEDLDVSFGGDNPPVITDLAVADACAGTTQGITATVTGTYTGISWALKKDGAISTDGTITVGASKELASVTWGASAGGTYEICGTPQSSVAGAVPFCKDVTVTAAPALEIARSTTDECVGTPVTLTPQQVGGAAVGSLLDGNSYKWTQDASATSLGELLTLSTQVPATSTVYHFTATTVTGNCPVAADITLQGVAAPVISGISTLVASGASLIDKKYYAGDNITFSVPNNADYTYAWTINGVSAGSGNSCQIESATAASYVVKVTVTNSAGCSTELTETYTLSAGCGLTVALQDHFNPGNPVRICANGVALIDAVATANCAGESVLYYVWYQRQADNTYKEIFRDENPGALKSTFAATVAGTYQVWVYSARGMIKSADLQVNASGSIYAADIVEAWDPVYIPLGGGPADLGANGNNIDSYYWKPEKWFTGSAHTAQFPTTSALSQATTFFVYGSHSDGCVSMDSSHVVLSDQTLDITIQIAGNPVCANGKIRLTAEVSNGSGNYDYTWATNEFTTGYPNKNKEMVFEANKSLIPAEGKVLTQTLYVKDTDTEVVGTAKAVINLSNLEDPKLKFDLVGNATCEGNTLSVVKNAGPNIATYYWFVRDESLPNKPVTMTTSTTPGLKLDKRGDYTVWVAAKTINVSGLEGCYSDTVNARLPLKVKGFDLAWSAQPAATYVSGQVLKAGAVASNSTTSNDYTFEWLSPAGGTMTSASQTTNPNNFQLEGAELAQYEFKVKVTNDGCPKELSEIVNRNATDNGLLLTLASDQVKYCANGAAIMSARATGGKAPYRVTWYKAGNESAPIEGPKEMAIDGGAGFDRLVITTPLSDGDKIVVKVEDGNTASPKIRRDTVTVNVTGAVQAPQISAGADRTIARGTSTYLLGEVLAEGNGITSWTWWDGNNLAADATTANPQTKVLNSATTYSAYVTDAAGCTSLPDEVEIRVTADPYDLAVDMNAPGLLCHNSKVPLSADVTPGDRAISKWQWTTTLGTLSNAALATPDWTMNVSANGTATLMVLVEDGAGVTAVDKAVVTVSNKTAPELILAGYNTAGGKNTVCSGSTELKVTEKNGIALSGYVWYADGTIVARDVDTYIHDVTSTSLVTVRVTASAASGGCPASNVAEVPLTAYPQPVIAWAASSTPEFVDANTAVKVTAAVTTTTKAPYTYTWKHISTPVNPNAPGYTDETNATGTPPAASSEANLAGGASADSHPYDFQVTVTDGNGCPSDEITRSIVVNDGSLYVTVASKYGDYCINGADVLVASVKGEGVTADNVTYQWYKNGTLMPGETAKELVIMNPNETDKYHVEVECGGKTGSTAGVPTQLKQGTNTAPTLTGIDLQIPTGSRTALVVDPNGAVITEWQWSPEDKLADGESTLSSPYTVVLNAPQQYTVYGVDRNKCVSAPAIVNVDVINVPNPGDRQEDLMVKAWPTPDTVCIGNELNIYTTVWSSVTGDKTYTWMGDNNLNSKNTSSVIFNPTNQSLTAGTYTYVVIVENAVGMKAVDRAVVKVIDGTTPTLAEQNPGDRCAGNDVVVKLTPSSGAEYTWIVNGVVDETVTGNTFTWPDVMDEAGVHYNLKVIAKTAGYCRTDTLSIDANVQPGVKFEGLQIADSCGQVVLYSKTKENANYSWSLTAGAPYLKTKAGGSADTCYIVRDMDFTTPSMGYTLQVEITPNGGGCKATGQYTGKLYYKPTARIAGWNPAGEATSLAYTMVEKDGSETVYLDAVNSQYTTTNSDIDWTALHATVTAASNKQTATVRNVAVDDSVFLTIANKEVATCQSRDTMPVYLYPEAPTLKIDTVDGSFVNAGLYLDGGSGDNYTIWSRKWDPYCLATRFTGDQVYKKEPTATNITDKLWKEPAMDTLEFYYATAGRTIAGRVWDSKTTSDTVGYYLFDLNLNTTLPSSNSYMAVYFDFAAMGCPTTLELCRRINAYNAQSMIQVYNFDYSTQSTKSNTYMGATDKVVGTALTMNMATIRIVPKAESKFMQYGKLPDVSFTLLRSNPTSVGNMNWIYVLPQKSHILEVDDLFAVDFMNVMQMFRWNFEGQTTSATSKLSPTAKPTGNRTALMPLQVIGTNLRNTIPSLDWK